MSPVSPEHNVDSHKRVVLITGCSAGGLGDALARAFHATGKTRVIATGRDQSKMGHFNNLGIETVLLDVLSQTSIDACVQEVTTKTNGVLDLLINNSGAGYHCPLADVDLDMARQLFDLNVWAPMAVTKSFLPLLLASASSGRNPMVVNQTSLASVSSMPFTGVYSASKAALASLTDTMRLEMGMFGIAFVDLKTGSVKSNFHRNMGPTGKQKLSDESIFAPAREIINDVMSGTHFIEVAIEADDYAQDVVKALLKNPKCPPVQLWKGKDAWLVWLGRTILPFTAFDRELKKMARMREIKDLVDRHRNKLWERADERRVMLYHGRLVAGRFEVGSSSRGVNKYAACISCWLVTEYSAY
ncbi:hypothetical protein B0A52_02243 [Exophiala mesophila]|uniref:NADPH-dependent 1-acyldihydroxyacetone phosphate reductase n=1 Tax=Exophiala mesophila TaxID=212818 RepID=A0A438NBG2_EXOME|nr:hypothetical protein B0A52_02243 [Exophiala mesophila]